MIWYLRDFDNVGIPDNTYVFPDSIFEDDLASYFDDIEMYLAAVKLAEQGEYDNVWQASTIAAFQEAAEAINNFSKTLQEIYCPTDIKEANATLLGFPSKDVKDYFFSAQRTVDEGEMFLYACCQGLNGEFDGWALDENFYVKPTYYIGWYVEEYDSESLSKVIDDDSIAYDSFLYFLENEILF